MLQRFLGRLGKKQKVNLRNPAKQREMRFTGRLSRDSRLIRDTFAKCGDVRFRELLIPALGKRALVVYVVGLVNNELINRDVVGGLLYSQVKGVTDVRQLLAVGEITPYRDLEEIKTSILQGQVLVVVDGQREALAFDVRDWPSRAVEEPAQERTIRGPREGFTEVAQTNVALVRRRLPTTSLKVENLEVGRRSKTRVSLLYIDDVADMDMVTEIRARVNAIDIDGILEPGAISELITERTITPFPLELSTERPDKVAGGLLSGKVVLMADGAPFAIILPVSFADFYQTPEDYYMHPLAASAGRLLRFVSLFVATTISAAYTVVVAYHYEMIPQDILIFLAETREAVPFTPFVEVFLLEIAVELVREASIRLPGQIGPTIGIVGALIIGQAAVEANLVSPILLIVVATGLMANFTLPNYEAALATRLLRFFILSFSALLGGLGLVVAWLIIAIHLCNLQSFGIPYMSPVAPFRVKDMGDHIWRRSWRWMRSRPELTAGKNITRQKGVESHENSKKVRS